MKRMLATLVFLFSLGMYECVQAETTGWSFGPFKSTTTKTDAGVQTPEPKSWFPAWKMPDVAGSVKKATKSVTSATSNAWTATTRTTKKAWEKTTTALDPFPDDPPKTSNGSSWGTPIAPKKSGFSSWFSGQETVDNTPVTANDWLRQERP